MKNYITALSIASMLAVTPSINATISFDDTNPATLTDIFPISNNKFVGGDSSVTVVNGTTTGDRMQVHAQQGQSDTATYGRSAAFSTALPEYNFTASAVTFSFNNVSQTNGAGLSNQTFYGVSSSATGALTSGSEPNDSIFFRVNPSTSAAQVDVFLHLDGVNTILATFNLLDTANATKFNFSTLSMSLTSTTWSLTVTQQSSSGTNSTVVGTFATPITTANWGSNTHLVIQATQPTSDPTRFTNALVESISITAIPEPAAYAAFAGVLCLAGTAFSRRRRV